MPTVQAQPGPSTRYWSTYHLAFLAILAFALVTVTAGVVFNVLEAPPPDEDAASSSAASASSARGGLAAQAGAGFLPPEVHEGSGIAVNREREVVWVHNDDPGAVVLFAVDLQGRLLSTHEIPEVRVLDLEDLDLGPCPPPSTAASCLYLADTGDNEQSRSQARIMAVTEPSGDGTAPSLVAEVAFGYEDGVPRDVEALAIAGERLLLVSKGQEGQSDVFEIGMDAFSAAGAAESQATARHVATLAIDTSDQQNRPTGAAMSPDGQTLGVRTAETMYLFPLDDLEAEPVACPIDAAEPQGEAVDFLDDERVLLTGEAGDAEAAPMVELACPGPN